MKLRRFFACMMALLLVTGMPLTALAEEYDLSVGSVTVNATDSGQTVTHGSNAAVEDSAPVITQSTETTTNTVTINAAENATANVTIQDVNIVISDPAGSPQDHSGEAAVTINVAENAEANVTLDGVNINTKNTGGVSFNPETGDLGEFDGEAAVQITGNGDVTLELDGDNTLWSGNNRAGVEKNTTDSSGKGNLTITDENGEDGSLKATGGGSGSGIGGGNSGSGSDITISGGKVEATGGKIGSGIGGGFSGSGSNITISGGTVKAIGGNYGSGIGGGYSGSGSNIIITGSGEVTAKGGPSGSGIGGGKSGTGSGITVSGDAQVKAQGGNSSASYGTGTGAAIGNGGKENDVGGDEVTPNTNDLNEGWIATYAPGTDMNTATPNSLTYKGASNVTGAQPIVKLEPTCTEDGHQDGFSVDGALVAVTIPKTGHSFTNYVPDGKAACTTDGTKTAKCEHCTATNTIPDPAKGHSFTNYISDGNATYEQDGTKTAQCDRCDATHTIPDPGSRLLWPEEAPRLDSLYQVLGQDGKALACQTAWKDGVLTITVDADFATLTGSFSGMKTLQEQGIDTIVFETNGASSTFALSDLLAQGSTGDTYQLTHDGETVTFTLGSGTDISNILK